MQISIRMYRMNVQSMLSKVKEPKKKIRKSRLNQLFIVFVCYDYVAAENSIKYVILFETNDLKNRAKLYSDNQPERRYWPVVFRMLADRLRVATILQ